MSDKLAESPGGWRLGKGQVLFTGPDGVGDFRVKVEDQQHIGIGTMSPEGTSDVRYLSRSGPNCPHPLPKGQRVGEVGWGVPKLSDTSLWKTKRQITLGEFRQAAEDKHTHLYQNPWYPAPEKTTGHQTKLKTKPHFVNPPEEPQEGSIQSSSSSASAVY
jgi:hypothetical protein